MSEKLIWKPTGEELTWSVDEEFLPVATLVKKGCEVYVESLEKHWYATFIAGDVHLNDDGHNPHEALNNLADQLTQLYKALSCLVVPC